MIVTSRQHDCNQQCFDSITYVLMLPDLVIIDLLIHKWQSQSQTDPFLVSKALGDLEALLRNDSLFNIDDSSTN